MDHRLGGGKSLALSPRRPKAPRAFADPLASRQEAPSAGAGNAGSAPPRFTKRRCDLTVGIVEQLLQSLAERLRIQIKPRGVDHAQRKHVPDVHTILVTECIEFHAYERFQSDRLEVIRADGRNDIGIGLAPRSTVPTSSTCTASRAEASGCSTNISRPEVLR